MGHVDAPLGRNTLEFMPPHTTATLRVDDSAERALIEVEDECDGLPGGNIDELDRR